MSAIKQDTPWSTLLIAADSMPIEDYRGKRGIFLGWTKDKKFIRVVVSPNATSSIFAPSFWSVDDRQTNSDPLQDKELTLRGILVQLDRGELLGEGGVDWAQQEIEKLYSAHERKAKIEALDHVIDIYNTLFEPNGEFRSFGSLKKEDVASLYLAIGEYIRDLQSLEAQQ